MLAARLQRHRHHLRGDPSTPICRLSIELHVQLRLMALIWDLAQDWGEWYISCCFSDVDGHQKPMRHRSLILLAKE